MYLLIIIKPCINLIFNLDIMLTIDILGLQRARRISGRNKLPPLPSDFTWMVGNKDTLTTSDHDMFEVCSTQLLIYTRIYIYVFIYICM